LEVFEFLGILLGFAVRSAQTFNIDLHPSVWKKIVGQPIDYKNDLNTLDRLSFLQLRNIKAHGEMKQLSEEEFQSMINYQNFTVMMGEGEPDKELVPGGADKLVTPDNYREYISLASKAHMHKDTLQMKYFLTGFHKILPANVISLINWRYAEVRAMGERLIDISVLKLHSKFHEGIKSEVKQWFWEVLTEMEEDDKRLYLKFVNGRSKLPTNIASIRYKHYVTLMHGGDNVLPQAHVCYFQIDLPNYSSKDVVRKNLLIAIRLCGEIDTDMNV
jgi:hypothetical protein